MVEGAASSSAFARPAHSAPGSGFWHEALLYAGDDEFVAAATAFLEEARAADEPCLVAVDRRKAGLLRAALGTGARSIQFVDMREIGRNPARIIPVWREFLSREGGPGRPVRGIGEPVWPERSADELGECYRHESLLNLAFADAPAWWLLCPYDTAVLRAEAVAEAWRTHPYVIEGGVRRESREYGGLEAAAAPFAEPLGDAEGDVRELSFDAASLGEVRKVVDRVATEAGLAEQRAWELVLAAHELAVNSVRHGGGRGVLRAWYETDAVVCEVRDPGTIADPLAGRTSPGVEAIGGRGLWLVNQLCDLVQQRSFANQTAVRIRIAR